MLKNLFLVLRSLNFLFTRDFIALFCLIIFKQEAKDVKLPEKIIFTIKDVSQKNDADCILLLFCKIKPIIRSMQRALTDQLSGKEQSGAKNQDDPDKIAILFQYLPSFDEFKNNSPKCEDEFKRCKVF